MNKQELEKNLIVKMRKELRGLRKKQKSKVNSELKAISHEIQKTNQQENLLNFLKNDFKAQMDENLQQIEKTETALDEERSALKAQLGQISEEEKAMQDELFGLEKKLRTKEKEMRAVQRDLERQIDAQKSQILTTQTTNAMLAKKIKREEKKLDEHEITKSKNVEYARLEKELEAIEKNNSMLKLIELQYQREIERRLKQDEKVKLELEIGEKIIDSPLRRARDYAMTIAGSPSPIKRIVTKGAFKFEISPEKTMPELREPEKSSGR